MERQDKPADSSAPAAPHPEESFFLRNRKTIWTVFFLIVVFDCVLAYYSVFIINDVAVRYAPMADAFAAGDFQSAFHPRFGMLFSVLTGGVSYLSGLNGFRSCQVVSLLFFWLTVFPLWHLFRRIWDERVATVGCFLFLICSYMTRFANYGLRDSCKAFGVAAGVYGVIAVFQNPRQWRGYLAIGFSGAFLISVRGDGAFLAMIILLAAALSEMKKFRRFPVRTFLSGLLLVVLISPQLYYCYDMLGYPVPECRHALILKRMGIPPMKEPEIDLP